MWIKGQITHDFADATGGLKDLLTRADQPALFDRLTWFQLLWAHNDIGVRPTIVRSWSSGVRGWLFLADQKGSRATGLANYYTLAFRPVFTGHPTDPQKRAMLAAMARRLRGRASQLGRITLAPVPRADGSAKLLADAFRMGGWWVARRPHLPNWTLTVNGRSFADYWAGRPGALRATVQRKAKKFGVETEVHATLTPALWADYVAIYADSWKPAEGSLAFLEALAMQESAAGCLRLGIARQNGVAVAAQLWTLEPGPPGQGTRAIIHKLAYRSSASDASPGSILTAAMFEHAIDTDKVAVIDYGTGDDRYKADWMEERQWLDRIICFNPRHLQGVTGALMEYMRGLRRASGDLTPHVD